jgi:hypothetical protein
MSRNKTQHQIEGMKRAQKRLAAANRQYINETKLAIGGCQICGLNCTIENLTFFDFDHKDPLTKKGRVGSMISRARQVIAEEIEKCQLLCKKCHKTRTAFENHYLVRRDGSTDFQRSNLISLFEEDEIATQHGN